MGAQEESIQVTAESSSSQGDRRDAAMCGLLQGLASLWQKRQRSNLALCLSPYLNCRLRELLLGLGAAHHWTCWSRLP